MRRLFLLCCVWWLSMPLVRATSLRADTLPSFLRHAIQVSGLPRHAYGFYVYDVTNHRTLLQYQADRLFHPASVMKLLTFSAAYDLLGPQYVWSTELLVDDRATLHGVYKGKVYWRVHGNPQWLFPDLLDMAESLYALGIHDIRGDMVVDASAMGGGVHGELISSRPDDPANRPYNVAPSPLLLNYRTLEFELTLADAAHVLVTPNTVLPAGCTIDNHVVVHAYEQHCAVHVNQLPMTDRSCHIVLSGEVSPHCFDRPDPWYVYLSLMSHEAFFQRSFARIWSDMGGHWSGYVRYGPVPLRHRLVAVSRSAPLYAIAHDALKFSNNVMTQSVFLTLSPHAVSSGQPMPSWSFSHARRALHVWLSEDHSICSPGDYQAVNGSGFAYHAWLTPRCVFQVLSYDDDRPYASLLRDNLPIAGVDGTMAERLKDDEAAGHIWVKTGTMKSVRGIAGYVAGRDGHTYIVVSFVNAHPNATPGLAVQDTLLHTLYWTGAQAFVHQKRHHHV